MLLRLQSETRTIERLLWKEQLKSWEYVLTMRPHGVGQPGGRVPHSSFSLRISTCGKLKLLISGNFLGSRVYSLTGRAANSLESGENMEVIYETIKSVYYPLSKIILYLVRV